MRTIVLFISISVFAVIYAQAQCNFIAATSTMTDTLLYNFSGGSFASYGCAPIDPTYWLSGSGNTVTVNFVSPQSYPSFRVWGMNTDDIATVSVNGSIFPLTSTTANYDEKVVCGLSPGPDGVTFSAGNLTGANTPADGNYSYQNVQLNITGVNTLTITGIAGAGWGFVGVTVECPYVSTEVQEANSDQNRITVYPNPVLDVVTFSQAGNIRVYDALGQLILVENNVSKIDFSAQQPGIFMVVHTDYAGRILQRSTIVKK